MSEQDFSRQCGLSSEEAKPDENMTRQEALSAFEELRRQAADVPEMTPDEINAEISEARHIRKEKR